MMIKKKSKLTLNISLIIFLCAVCVTSAFDFKKPDPHVIFSYHIDEAKNSDEASVLFWNWLLKYTKLTAKTASIHNIYQQDSAAFFYDLDEDGKREIMGTHYASAVSGMGDCFLYILKYDKEKNSKYKLISDDLYFDADMPIEILEEKSGNYHKIRASSQLDDREKIFIFDKRKGLYIEK